MALKTFVKVGSISNLGVARYCAGMGVDQLGFNADETADHYMSPGAVGDIMQWISGVEVVIEGAKPVGRNEDYLFDFIETSLQGYKLNFKYLDGLDKPLVYKVDYTSIQDLSNLYIQHKQSYILLSGQGKRLTLDQQNEIRALARQYPVVLDFGFDQENAAELPEELNLKGLALKGVADENSPEFDHLMHLLEVLSTD